MTPPCLHIPELPEPLALRLPGGVTIQQLGLIQAIQPALAPLTPLFSVLDALVAVVQCVKAIPDALGPPPNPAALAARLPELARKMDTLLQLLPQLSLPTTIVDTIDLLLETLREASAKLRHLQDEGQRLMRTRARAEALGDEALLAVTDCAQQNLDREADNVGASLASLGKLTATLNGFLEVLGLAAVPNLSHLRGWPLDPLLGLIESIIESLRVARDAVPVP